MVQQLTSEQADWLESEHYKCLARRYAAPEMRREAIRMVRLVLRRQQRDGVSTSEMAGLLDAPYTAENRRWIQCIFECLEQDGTVAMKNGSDENVRAFWVKSDAG